MGNNEDQDDTITVGTVLRWTVIAILVGVIIGLVAAKIFPPESAKAYVTGIYPWANPHAGWIRYDETHGVP